MTKRKPKDSELWGLFRKSDVEAEYQQRLERVINACAKAGARWYEKPGEPDASDLHAAIVKAGTRAAKVKK